MTHLLARLSRLFCRGGRMPAYRPGGDEVPVLLSPGSWPPELERYYGQGRRR